MPIHQNVFSNLEFWIINEITYVNSPGQCMVYIKNLYLLILLVLLGSMWSVYYWKLELSLHFSPLAFRTLGNILVISVTEFSGKKKKKTQTLYHTYGIEIGKKDSGYTCKWEDISIKKSFCTMCSLHSIFANK